MVSPTLASGNLVLCTTLQNYDVVKMENNLNITEEKLGQFKNGCWAFFILTLICGVLSIWYVWVSIPLILSGLLTGVSIALYKIIKDLEARVEALENAR